MNGGERTQTVELPKELEAAAKQNLKLAEEVGRLPFAPYFGPSVAAFTPMQEASFANTNAAANAFGLASPQNPMAGMPQPMNVGGFRGYSTQPLYENAMSRVDPAVLAMYNAFFGPGGSSSPAGGGGGSTGRSGSSGAGPWGFPTGPVKPSPFSGKPGNGF